MGDIKAIKEVITGPAKKFHKISRVGEKTLLRMSIAVIYLWFGILKFFENLSPAEELAGKTLTALCFGIIPEFICYLLLAIMETLIGLMLLLNMFLARTIKLTFLHLIGTFTPIFLQPETFFNDFPFSLTLIGQYILKNIVILCALIIIYPKNKN